MPSARQEARRFTIPLFVLGFALLITGRVLRVLVPEAWIDLCLALDVIALLVLGLGFFVMYFFRDPERDVPADEKIIVSAADGLVVGVEEMDEPDFQLGRRLRIAVFLSVFDVHVNRSPVAGRVQKSTYKPGEFLDVRHPESSTRNECRSWLLETEQGPVAVRQIAGLVARRIVAWSKPGEPVARGQRFGMIRFGSRTEVFLPLECSVLVKVGDRVAGASSPLARWP